MAAQIKSALAHHLAGRFARAEGMYRQILVRHPNDPTSLHLLGLIAIQAGDNRRAVQLIERAIAANERVAKFHWDLGIVLRRMDRLEDALKCVERAAQLDPDIADIDLERGHALAALGRPAEAIVAFDTVLAGDPDSVFAHFGIATAALALGDFKRGWAEYEARWRYTTAEFGSSARGFTQPLWDGQALPGGTILLHAEQGLGDTLQFARYAPLVKAGVGRVLLECQPELRGLLEGMPGVDVVLSRGDPLPDFDVQAPLMSLPWLVGTLLSTIPNSVPYVPPPMYRPMPDKSPGIARDARLKVGLVWAGHPGNEHDHKRSVSLAACAPLLSVPDVAFFALQKGPAGAQVATPPPGAAVTDLGPTLRTFSDTADAISQLDLVITVDTAVAHLAGVMGKTVWVLLAFAADFRWLLDREDSPWYPTARLFRQHQRGDWDGVMQDVSVALLELATAHRRTLATPAENAITTRARSSGTAPGAGGVVAALPVSGDIGWAVCGRHNANELAQLTPVCLMTDPFDLASVGDEPTYRALAGLSSAQPDQHTPQRLPKPVLQAITNCADFSAFRPNLRSTTLTVGYTFFEENILTPLAVEHAAQRYDHIVTGSTWCEDVLRRYKLEAVSTILQGIDPLLFHPSAAPGRQFGDRFVVFSGGKLEFRKGQDLVIRAFKVLQDRHPDVLLVNAWFNPWTFSVETMAASPYIEFEHTLEDHVDFVSQLLVANGINLEGVVTLPAQPNARMPSVYWDTDVGLFPNRCEGGTNLVLMEYMAAGKPAIASYSSGHRDIVTEHNALLITQMTPLLMNDDDRPIAIWDDPSLDETIERLEWAYQHPADLKGIAEQAGHDLGAHTWTRTAAAFLAVLEPHITARTVPVCPVELRLKAGDVRKLEGFLDRLSSDVYPEELSEPHLSITRTMVERVLTSYPQSADAGILDVGCGQGLALSQFAARGLRPRGIALGHDDVAVCREAGFDVQVMDQSFLDFSDAEFDLVWCRHCLEHSIFPYFTLSEFQRVLKPGGILYIEVPAPDTACAHQATPNNYSVLGKSMWLQLMTRSGFALIEELDLNFTVPAGPDTYWAFVLRKL
ncbi:MAG TPA: methyltransferase domain-containing protein [Chloroflexota bacterium]|nr:methyltransferase domain-containing protein [Chloroflexota bacterium]